MKNILVTGVATADSLAWQAVRVLAADPEVGRVILAVFPSRTALTQRIPALVATLPFPDQGKVLVVGLNVDDPESLGALAYKIDGLIGGKGLDGVLHSIARLHPRAMGPGDRFMDAEWADLEQGMKVSAYSYVSLLRALEPVLNRNASAVALSFHSREPMAGYGWMGIVKAVLEREAQHLAAYYGPKLNAQVNVISAAVYPSVAATAIPGYDQLVAAYERTPLVDEDGLGLGRTVASFLLGRVPLVTGSTIYADRGYRETTGIDPRIMQGS